MQKEEYQTHFCLVGDQPGCVLLERTIQTTKRKLGAIQLAENCPRIQDSLKSINYDIRTTENSVTHFSPFEHQYGGKPNSEWSVMSANLKEKFNVDQQKLARDALTPQEQRESYDGM